MFVSHGLVVHAADHEICGAQLIAAEELLAVVEILRALHNDLFPSITELLSSLLVHLILDNGRGNLAHELVGKADDGVSFPGLELVLGVVAPLHTKVTEE
jgi:hypothetical protein